LECKHRFTTYERVEFVPITVVKADGKKESFDPSKLLRGMVRACEKTGLSYQRLERIVEDIEAQIQQGNSREITSQNIGQLVLKYLQKENEVAYIRFASVYGRFQGITDFVETLNHLKTDSPSSWEMDNDALIEEDSTVSLAS
jgi:transcriptional repressor NrdR